MADLTRKGLIGEIKDADAEDLTIVSHINTAALDRDKEVVLPSGAQLETYRKNPMVLWHHDYGPDSLPLGKNLWIKTDKSGLLAKTQFNPKLEFSRDVYHLYADGFMAGWSIGAGDIDVKEPTEDELRAHPEWAGARGIWHSWELLEYSAVKVPANPEALTLGKAQELGLSPITIKMLDIKAAPKATPPPPVKVQPIRIIVPAPKVVKADPVIVLERDGLDRTRLDIGRMVADELRRRLGAVRA